MRKKYQDYSVSLSNPGGNLKLCLDIACYPALFCSPWGVAHISFSETFVLCVSRGYVKLPGQRYLCLNNPYLTSMVLANCFSFKLIIFIYIHLPKRKNVSILLLKIEKSHFCCHK